MPAHAAHSHPAVFDGFAVFASAYAGLVGDVGRSQSSCGVVVHRQCVGRYRGPSYGPAAMDRLVGQLPRGQYLRLDGLCAVVAVFAAISPKSLVEASDAFVGFSSRCLLQRFVRRFQP